MEDISKRSLRMTKIFNAPVELVWEVLTTADYVKEWWGPDGFTNTIRKMEVEEGGRWEFTMHGPDGTDYENEYVYSELKPLERIVLDHLKYPKFTISITLFNEGEQTRVEWLNVFDTVPGLEEAVRAFKADIGLEQNMARFSAFAEERYAKH